MIYSHNWDNVILRGVGPILACPKDARSDLIATLESPESTIHGNCSTTRIMLFVPWAFEGGMTRTPGGTDAYFDMQQHIYDNTLTYPELADIVIGPVGRALLECRHARGTVAEGEGPQETHPGSGMPGFPLG